jgi:hypothetical protein
LGEKYFSYSPGSHHAIRENIVMISPNNIPDASLTEAQLILVQATAWSRRLGNSSPRFHAVIGPIEADDHVGIRAIITDAANETAAFDRDARKIGKIDGTPILDFYRFGPGPNGEESQ